MPGQDLWWHLGAGSIYRRLGLFNGGYPCLLEGQTRSSWSDTSAARADSHAEVLGEEAAVPEQTCPQLDSHDAEDEEDKETEEKDIPQHGQRVQKKRHQDAHT